MRTIMLKTTLCLVLFYIFPALSFSFVLRERFLPRNFTLGTEINFCQVNLVPNKMSRFTNFFGKGIQQNVPKRNSSVYTKKFGLDRANGVETACWEFQDECNDNNAKTPPIIKLLDHINDRYLGGCITVIKYDEYYEYNEEWILDYFLRQEQSPHIHGSVEEKDKNSSVTLSVAFKGRDCRNYIFLISDVLRARERIGWHVGSKVVIITRSSKGDIHDFLRHFTSSAVRNLLIVANSKNESSSQRYPDINMYTHQLFADRNGSSIPQILTAWRCSTLTRPHISLFPPKMRGGLNGYSVKVVLGHQPPFVFPKLSKINPDLIDKCNYTAPPDEWDGREVRLLRLLSTAFNFTLIFREVHASGIGKEVASKMVQQLMSGKVHVAAGGIRLTPSRLRTVNMDIPHSQDCITFVTKASVAMPRYRAIMGPFHWKVWVAVTMIYVLAMFPLAFSHRHSLSDLLTNPWEMENMFWYVFGTFTNCFTFRSKSSWSQAEKSATKMLIGWYWVFTIIITACYTGSIIAFVTLPVYPAFVDTSQELLDRRFRVGTLEGGGYEKLLNDSADPVITALLERLEFVPRVSDGILNITKAFYRPYAYLGSRTLLDFILKANYTSSSEGTRARFHLADECVVPFHLALAFPMNATYAHALNRGTLMAFESGLFSKIKKDVKWENERTSKGKLLQAAVASSVKSITDRRKLSLDDVQGTFLLLGAGLAIGLFALFLECVNWMWKTKSCWCFKRTSALTEGNSIANHN